MTRIFGITLVAFALLSLSSGDALMAGKATLSVQVDKPGAKISPDLWGIFFEEINHAGDGGLYAELVSNRSFEDVQLPEGTLLKGGKAVTAAGFGVGVDTSNPLPGWALVTSGGGKGSMALDKSQPLNDANPHSLCLRIAEVGAGRVGAANAGYWGIALAKDAEYECSLYARCDEAFKGPLAVSLEHPSGEVYARAAIPRIGGTWKRYACTLKSSGGSAAARLVVSASSPGTLWLDMVSLFPRKTWKERPNGLRVDLATMLADMKPSFVRFPGGCYVEGISIENAHRWKNTIGDIAARPGRWCLWGYRSTEGLGFHEYLQMCEDLGAAAMFVINCGLSCQGRRGQVVPKDQLGPWLQDALDAIEYANGPEDSKWGAVRAGNGHPKPFGNLKYLEIGNENSGGLYEERYAAFHDTVKAKYPAIQLIANAPVRSRPMDILDEHYYSSPEFFAANARRYDTYDRKGPRIYVGEFACTQGCGRGNLRAAVGEAAFMCGMERNGDIVVMGSYAPLFVNVNNRCWNPDAICFNATSCWGIPSYHVHKMFSTNRCDVVLPCKVGSGDEGIPPDPGAIGLSTWATQAEFKDLKVTSGQKVLYESDFAKDAAGWKVFSGDWKVVEGAYRQTAGGGGMRSVTGDPKWDNYTCTLKARKIGGAEGFLIMFRVRDEGNWLWWNIGGWGNTRHAIEKCSGGGKSSLGAAVPGRVETGRWYDVKIELAGPRIRCYLDGKLIHDVEDSAVLSGLHVVAGRSGGEVVLKVVNTSQTPQDTQVTLDGADLADEGTAIVLTGSSPADENSLDDPTKVAPVTRQLKDVGSRFNYTFPPCSLTILRLKVK